MIRTIIYIILLLQGASLFSGSWEEYISFEFGSNENQLGAEELYDTGLAMTISTFGFDREGNLFIVDNCNKRVVIYDKNGLLQDIILKNQNIILGTNRILIQDPYLYLINSQAGILKYHIDNKNISWIKKKSDIESFKFNWKNIYTYKDKLIYYTKTNNIISLKVINKDGEIMDIDNKKYVDSFSPLDSRSSNDPVFFSSGKNEFIDEKGLLYPDRNSSYSSFLEYSKKSDKKSKDKEFIHFDHRIDGDINTDLFLGYDKNNLIYFLLYTRKKGDKEGYKKTIVVFSKSGKLLSKFQLGPSPEKANFGGWDTIKIDYDGNVYYFWAHTEMGAKIYKYKRDW